MLSAGSEPGAGLRSRSETASGRVYGGWDIARERLAVDGDSHPAAAAFGDQKDDMSVDFGLVGDAVGDALGGGRGRLDSGGLSSIDGGASSPGGRFGPGGGGRLHSGASGFMRGTRESSAASGVSGAGLGLGTVGEEAEGAGTPTSGPELHPIGSGGGEGHRQGRGQDGALDRGRMASVRSADSAGSIGGQLQLPENASEALATATEAVPGSFIPRSQADALSSAPDAGAGGQGQGQGQGRTISDGSALGLDRARAGSEASTDSAVLLSRGARGRLSNTFGSGGRLLSSGSGGVAQTAEGQRATIVDSSSGWNAVPGTPLVPLTHGLRTHAVSSSSTVAAESSAATASSSGQPARSDASTGSPADADAQSSLQQQQREQRRMVALPPGYVLKGFSPRGLPIIGPAEPQAGVPAAQEQGQGQGQLQLPAVGSSSPAAAALPGTPQAGGGSGGIGGASTPVIPDAARAALPPNHPQSVPVQSLLHPGMGLHPFSLAQMLTHGHPHGPYGRWTEDELASTVPEEEEFGAGDGSDKSSDEEGGGAGGRKRGGRAGSKSGRGRGGGVSSSKSSDADSKERKRLRKREARKRMAKQRREREIEAERLRLELRALRAHRFGARVVSPAVLQAVDGLKRAGRVAEEVVEAAAVDGPQYLPGPRGTLLKRVPGAGGRRSSSSAGGSGASRRGGRRGGAGGGRGGGAGPMDSGEGGNDVGGGAHDSQPGAGGAVRASPGRPSADLQFLGSDAELLHLLSIHGRARPRHLRSGAMDSVEDPAPVDIGLSELAAGAQPTAAAAVASVPSGYGLDLGTDDPVGFQVDAGISHDEFAAAAVVADGHARDQSAGGDLSRSGLQRMGPSGAVELPLRVDLGRIVAEPIGDVTPKELQERRWGGFEQSQEVRATAGADATPHERAGEVRASVTALRATCVSLHRKVRELGYLVCAARSSTSGSGNATGGGPASERKQEDASGGYSNSSSAGRGATTSRQAKREQLMRELAQAVQLTEQQRATLEGMQGRVMATRNELKPLCGTYQALRAEGVHGFRGAEALHDLLRSVLEPEKAKALMAWVSRVEGRALSTDRQGRPLPPHARLGGRSFRPDFAQLGRALDDSAYSKLQKRGGGVSVRSTVGELLDLARRRGRPGVLAREAAESQLGRALAAISMDEPYGRIVPISVAQQLARARSGQGIGVGVPASVTGAAGGLRISAP